MPWVLATIVIAAFIAVMVKLTSYLSRAGRP